MTAKLMEVIFTDFESRGDGTEGNPHRQIQQYWSTDGKLLAEVDIFLESKRLAEKS